MDRAQEIISAWNRDEVALILQALSAVDEQDLDFLVSCLPDSGCGQFWKAVVRDLRPVFALEISTSTK